jgi:hypothetical protein
MVGYEAGGPDEDLEWEHRECFRDDQINLSGKASATTNGLASLLKSERVTEPALPSTETCFTLNFAIQRRARKRSHVHYLGKAIFS